MDIIDYIKSFPVRQFTKDEVLLSADEQTSEILIIREGIVKASSLDEAGRQKLLWIAGRYDIVPTEHLFAHTTTTQYFYTAYCDGSAYVVDKKSFLEKASDDAKVMSQIARGLSEHHDDLLSRLNSVEQSDVRSKILHSLYGICVKFASSDVVHLHELGLNLTHQDIADMVGATREAASIELKKLRDERLVKYSRSSFTVYAKRIADEIKAPV